MTHTTEEIRAMLAAATPGPWKRDPYNQPYMQVIAHGNEVVSYHRAHNRQVDARVVANHELMAAAPTIIRELLAEVTRLRGAVEDAYSEGFIEAFEQAGLDDCDYNRVRESRTCSWRDNRRHRRFIQAVPAAGRHAMTNEQLAAWLDPDRKGEWFYNHSPKCPQGHDIPSGRNISSHPYKCNTCGVPLLHGEVTWETACDPPAFDTDDLAAFTYLRGPLLAAGCHIHDYAEGASVVRLGSWISDHEPLKLNDYAAALSTAFEWLTINQPERLRAAVKEATQ